MTQTGTLHRELAASSGAADRPRAMRPRLGALFAPHRPLGELIDAARQAERVGLDELWVVEDCFLHGGLTAAATALGATSHLRVGLGLLPAAARNAAFVAMEIATLAALHPYRFRAAFGHGVDGWMRQVGARPARRVAGLGEVVSTVRALLRGESVTTDGVWVSMDDVRLERPPASAPPILIGTTGERGIALAGEVADGVLLPEGTGPGALEWVVGAVGRETAIVTYAWLRVDQDGERARDAVRPAIHAWRDGGLYPNLVERSGIAPAGELDLDEVDRVAVAGTPLECARALMRLGDAGATSVVLAPVGDPVQQLEAFGDEVLPLMLAEALSR